MADWLDRTNAAWPYWSWDNCCPDYNELRLRQQMTECAGRSHLTRDSFFAIFPMFSCVPDEWLDMLLDQARSEFSAAAWRGSLQWGEALFVAHHLTLRKMLFGSWDNAPCGSGATPCSDSNGSAWLSGAVTSSAVTSFRAGSVAWTQDASMAAKIADDPLKQTVFGQQLLDLLRSRVAVGLVTVT